MGKRIPVPVWTIILFLLAGIGSMTLVAWNSDTAHLKKDIKDNTDRIISTEIKCSEYATIDYVDKQDLQHRHEVEELNKERQNQLDLMQSDIVFIKNYIIKQN